MSTVATKNTTTRDAVMAYEHPALIDRLHKKCGFTTEEASLLFEDMKKWLYICGTCPEHMAPAPKIDEAWHNFILFTKDYADFCEEFFGHFIHHRPHYPGDKPDHGKLVFITLEKAREAFGDTLSANWQYPITASDCDKCSGSTNCEADPPDCAKN